MFALTTALLLCTALALAVVALVAVPARREGRDLLAPRGEEVMAKVRERTEATLERTGDLISTSRERVHASSHR